MTSQVEVPYESVIAPMVMFIMQSLPFFLHVRSLHGNYHHLELGSVFDTSP